jgi:hypothetical protein
VLLGRLVYRMASFVTLLGMRSGYVVLAMIVRSFINVRDVVVLLFLGMRGFNVFDMMSRRSSMRFRLVLGVDGFMMESSLVSGSLVHTVESLLSGFLDNLLSPRFANLLLHLLDHQSRCKLHSRFSSALPTLH